MGTSESEYEEDFENLYKEDSIGISLLCQQRDTIMLCQGNLNFHLESH